MGCKVSLCLEMPIGFEYIGLGIEMAKGNLNNAHIKKKNNTKNTFDCH